MSAGPVTAKPSNSHKISRALAAALIIAGLAYRPTTHHLRAASVLTCISNPTAQGFLAHYGTNEVSTEDFAFNVNGSAIRSRIYTPAGVEHPPAIVILHGVHHLGIEEPRLKNFSRAMASHGYVILTPELPGIDDYHVNAAGIDVIGGAAQELRRRTGAARVGLLGLSFAGGLALVAASDARYSNDIGFVTAVGAQDDVARVLRFFATNQIELPSGATEKMQAHEYGPLVVVYSHPADFFSADDAPIAERALRYLLWEDLARAHAESAKMSADGQRRMQLLFDDHTESLAATLLASIEKYRAEYAPASPKGNMAGLHAPVFLLHGAADNVIPPAETLWLEHDLPTGLLRERLISPVVSHVELGGNPSVRDQLELVHWMSAMLDEADRQRSR
jgi:dienelactone hydrolase